jgi:hypothetical protein
VRASKILAAVFGSLRAVELAEEFRLTTRPMIKMEINKKEEENIITKGYR